MNMIVQFLLIFFLSVSYVYAQAEPAIGPTDLNIQVADATLSLTWTDNATNENAYHVERKVDQGPWRALATLAANSVAHTDGVEFGHRYCYRVYATTAWISGFSNEVCIDIPIPAAPPPMPTHVRWLSNLVLMWDDVQGELGYHIKCDQKARASTPVADLPANMTAWHNNKTALTLEPCCTVIAWNLSGPSSESDKACTKP